MGVVVIAHLVLRYTEMGRRIYAIGGNEEAARLSGVPVNATKVLVYGTSGLLSALTGVLWAAQYHPGVSRRRAGRGELDAIAAVVIGGTSLMGGRGKSGHVYGSPDVRNPEQHPDAAVVPRRTISGW